MKIAEIRELSISPMDNPSQIKQQRRLIARMKTELRQRELNNKN